ncbi:hypothetical protein B7H23_08485 [Notoacmeibacter marinus]|uniref:DUF3035 domain-containing protein n=1 Tax=Notoacmeibacter marinus TaxID=1876515 RepID=A0A231UWI4_9HYPH|nr:hypothetical protein [Notoacmeibacter marinus]OXT00207.1 hypothetical protein B7H23_08485 [Notoacmeibacter marinus]
MYELIRLAGLSAVLLLCASCGSDEINFDDPRIANDGTFPNLNRVPVPAAAPFDSQEAQVKIQVIDAARPQSRTVPTSEAETARLRRLGQTHAQDALRQIESSGN